MILRLKSALDSFANNNPYNPPTPTVKVRAVVASAAWLHDVLDHKMVKNQAEYDQKEMEINKW